MTYSETTTSHIRHMLALRWREHDPSGVWFWGSWLLIRWNVIPILAAVIGGVIGYYLIGGIQ